jgi:hypothetical protein
MSKWAEIGGWLKANATDWQAPASWMRNGC